MNTVKIRSHGATATTTTSIFLTLVMYTINCLFIVWKKLMLSECLTWRELTSTGPSHLRKNSKFSSGFRTYQFTSIYLNVFAFINCSTKVWIDPKYNKQNREIIFQGKEIQQVRSCLKISFEQNKTWPIKSKFRFVRKRIRLFRRNYVNFQNCLVQFWNEIVNKICSKYIPATVIVRWFFKLATPAEKWKISAQWKSI